MSLTSARFAEVWPSSTSSHNAVSARVAHVVNRDLPPSDIQAVLDEMYQEMTHRTNMFIVVLIVITIVLVHRIGRLEQRLMVHSMGASLPCHWW